MPDNTNGEPNATGTPQTGAPAPDAAAQTAQPVAQTDNPNPADPAGDAAAAGKPAAQPPVAGAEQKKPDGAAPDVPVKPADAKAADTPKSILPENWRDEFARNDKGDVDPKLLTELNRYKSPADFAKALVEAKAKIRAGELKAKALPKDATDAEKAEYRKANGIPEKAEGYLDALPDGIVFGQDDQAAVKDFTERMHERNASPELVAESLNMFHELRDQRVAEQVEYDEQARADAVSTLRAEMGPDYQRNMAAVNNFITTSFPGDLAKALQEARLGDDHNTPLLCHKGAIRALAGIALELNPSGAGSPPNGENRIGMIEDRLNEIHAKELAQGDWFKNEPAQKNYRDLQAQYKKQTGKDWVPR